MKVVIELSSLSHCFKFFTFTSSLQILYVVAKHFHFSSFYLRSFCFRSLTRSQTVVTDPCQILVSNLWSESFLVGNLHEHSSLQLEPNSLQASALLDRIPQPPHFPDPSSSSFSFVNHDLRFSIPQHPVPHCQLVSSPCKFVSTLPQSYHAFHFS